MAAKMASGRDRCKRGVFEGLPRFVIEVRIFT
jgi:hypothetical protein